jgi:hypothetical protein
MKKPCLGIIILVFALLVFAGFVFAEPALLAPQNNWDPRVYDPLCVQEKTTTVTNGFYNISFLMFSNDHATINKVLFAPYQSPLSIQNVTNLMVYVNGTASLIPFNMQGGDIVQANLLVPVDGIQLNMTYEIKIFTDSMFYCSIWNPDALSPA